MKPNSFLFPTVILLMVACAPQNVAIPPPTAVFTNTVPPATIAEPTQTLEPTPTPSPAAEIPSCVKLADARLSSTGVLEVVYASGDPYTVKKSQFLFPMDAEHTRLALWSDATQEADPYPLPPDALGPKLSTDRQWIVFRRDSGQKQSELWAIGTDGQNERKLTTILYDEIEARYPNLAGIFEATLDYGSIPNMEKIYYHVIPGGGVGGPANYDMFVLADIDSGQTLSLGEPGEVSNVVFAPDGKQAAVLTSSELRLVSTQDGNVQVILPMTLRSFGPEGSSSPAYSADGKSVIGFTDEGMVRINAADGQWQVIPLTYKPISAPGDSPNYWSPKVTWFDNSTIFLPISEYEPAGGTFEIDVFELLTQPDATFTVWRVDLIGGTTEPVQTFTGFPPSVVFSPDGKRLAFSKSEGEGQPGKLFLADLNTGNILETLEGSGLFAWNPDFIAWHPDSNRYVYRRGEDPDAELYLGQIGAAPIRLGEVFEPIGSPTWTNAERFLITMGFCEIRRISVGRRVEEVIIIP